MTRLLTSEYISVGVTYISWFSDFALYLEYYLLDKCHTWDISSMWPNKWPLTISRSLWPTFHASVILPFIFITISWRIVIPGLLYLWQNDLHTNTSRSVWPILYGLMIKMLQYKMYPAGELAVLRQLLFFFFLIKKYCHFSAGLGCSVGCAVRLETRRSRVQPRRGRQHFSWRLIMKYFLQWFSPLHWFKKGSCHFLAKEYAQYWLTA